MHPTARATVRAPASIAAILGLLMVSACTAGEDAGAPPEVDESERIAQVESGLLPAVVLEGEARPAWTLEERMDHYDVPGVSVAVIEGGELVWSKGYGLADPETGQPVTTETLFQAASISKPVAAIAALSMVEEGLLDLDAPVNEALTTWRIPDSEFSADSAVTLRHLLTHSAGLTVWGFPGYRKDEPWSGDQVLPTNAQILDGQGNTDAVRLFKVPGISMRYSGGGYTVMEQLLEDVAGLPIEEVVDSRVLNPAGMTRSTYQQPLPEGLWPQAARGHASDGTEIEGEWHSYPEQAAAGLWTTPEDLATLSVHLLDILEGSRTDGVLSAEMVEAMLTPNHGGAEGWQSWGLGFGLSPNGEPRTFGHGGSNAGFKAQWVVYRDAGQGAVVMTNGDRGSPLAGEIIRAVAETYGWPGNLPETRSRIVPDAATLERLAGAYDVEGAEVSVTLEAGPDGTLIARVPGDANQTFYAATADSWFTTEGGPTLDFERGADGAVARATFGGTVLVKR